MCGGSMHLPWRDTGPILTKVCQVYSYVSRITVTKFKSWDITDVLASNHFSMHIKQSYLGASKLRESRKAETVRIPTMIAASRNNRSGTFPLYLRRYRHRVDTETGKNAFKERYQHPGWNCSYVHLRLPADLTATSGWWLFQKWGWES